jgi:hypothetical protein
VGEQVLRHNMLQGDEESVVHEVTIVLRGLRGLEA